MACRTVLLSVFILALQEYRSSEAVGIVEGRSCIDSQAAGNQSFSEQVAPSNKPPMMGLPTRIRLLHEPSGYGYIGDLCVPSYNLMSRGRAPENGKWRVVCKAPSQIFTVLLAMEMPQGEYLQMRRRALRGSTQTFHGSSLKKNSVLFGHVRAAGLSTEERSPFRLAYFCASKGFEVIAEQIFLNQAVLDYIQSRPDGLDKAAYILTHFFESVLSEDPVLKKIIDMAAVDKET